MHAKLYTSAETHLSQWELTEFNRPSQISGNGSLNLQNMKLKGIVSDF